MHPPVRTVFRGSRCRIFARLALFPGALAAAVLLASCLERDFDASTSADVTADTSTTPKDTTKPPVIIRDTVRDTVIAPPKKIAVTGITAENIYMPIGVAKARPLVTILPRTATNQDYSLQSLDASVAKVSGRELIPLKAGTARIRAKSDEGGFTAEFQATVLIQDTNRYETEVSAAAMELTEGGPAQAPSITWKPADVTQRGYSLTSANPARVQIVTEDGIPKCKPLAAGDVDVTLKTLGKGLTAKFKVTVKPAPILTFPVLGISAQAVNLDLGAPDVAPKVSYSPPNATNRTYSLQSDNPGVVSVADTLLHAAGGGTALVTITSADGPSNAFRVTVKVRVQAISYHDTTLEDGQEAEIAADILPANADNLKFSLASDQPGVVKAEAHRIQAKKPGVATITLTAEDGGVTGSFKVTVADKPVPPDTTPPDSIPPDTTKVPPTDTTTIPPVDTTTAPPGDTTTMTGKPPGPKGPGPGEDESEKGKKKKGPGEGPSSGISGSPGLPTGARITWSSIPPRAVRSA
jgi:uncharacterized protein YjdB